MKCQVKEEENIQSTTRTTEFFVVGKMSGILVRFVILVGQIPNPEAEDSTKFNQQ